MGIPKKFQEHDIFLTFSLLHVNSQNLNTYIAHMYSWFSKGCFGHCELRNSKLLFGGHSGKSMHCLVCPIAATFTESAIHSVASGKATIPSYK